MVTQLFRLSVDLSKYLDDYSLQEISQIGWIRIDKLNADINQNRPWALLNADAKNELHSLLDGWFGRARNCSQGSVP